MTTEFGGGGGGGKVARKEGDGDFECRLLAGQVSNELTNVRAVEV